MTATKTCPKCQENKPLSEFPTPKVDPVNFDLTATDYKPCKACAAEAAREWRKQHKNYSGSGKLKAYPKEDWPLMSAIRARLREAKQRIKKFGKPETDLTEEFLYRLFKEQEGKCALLGCEMTIERKHPLALSLDQINPSEGYTEANIQWVTWAANRAKGDMTQDDFYDMCELATSHRKVQRPS